MSGFRAVWDGLDWSALLGVALGIIPAVICITLHELSHGLAAYRLGDDTAKNAGRLTLNPLKSLDWMGLLAMALFHFGWAKPVMINPANFENPKRGMALTALAGPVSNFIITVVFLFLYGLLYTPLVSLGNLGRILMYLIQTTAEMSLMLGLFNLIPVPPLDGSKVLFSLLRDDAYWKLMRYERYGFLVILVLTRFTSLSGYLGVGVDWVLNKLYVVARFAFDLVN